MRFKVGDRVRIKDNWFTHDNCKELIGKIKVIDRVIDNSGLFYYLKDTETIIFEITDLELVNGDINE